MEQYCKITINANCLLQTEVLVQPLGKGQEVVLNRPKALNALNLNMVHLLRPHYTVPLGSFPRH
jgi:hypothetical protein